MLNSRNFDKACFTVFGVIAAGILLWKSSCSTLGIVLAFVPGGAMLGLYLLGRWVEENSS